MKIRILASAIALTTVVGAVDAQQMVITTALKNEANQYAGWLQTAFDSIPAAKFGFRPTPSQMSVGTVAAHLEYANYLLCSYMSGMPHPFVGKDTLDDSVRGMWPRDTLLTRLKASFAFCTAAWNKVSDANLADSVPTGPPFIKRKNARARLVVLFTTDLVDHYSQMANYMRIMGMIPPSSYPPPKS